jgi:dimethylamine monooxygenase subunit C
MKNQPNLVPNKRKYLFLADRIGMTILNPMIKQAKINNESIEIVLFNKQIDFQQTDINQWLGEQLMGTYLYVSLPWEELHPFKQKVEEIGYSEEEYQCFGYGEKIKNVFCCRCHGITHVGNEKVEVICLHCNLLLEVSDHYSTLRDAFLGYVAKL